MKLQRASKNQSQLSNSTAELLDWAFAFSSIKRLRSCHSFHSLSMYFEERDCGLDAEDWCQNLSHELRMIVGKQAEGECKSGCISSDIAKLLRKIDQQCLPLLQSVASEYLRRHVHNKKSQANTPVTPMQKATQPTSCSLTTISELPVLES